MASMLQRGNALRGPDWRWQLARKLAAGLPVDGGSRLAAQNPKVSQTLEPVVRYLRDQAAGVEYSTLAAQYAPIVAAVELHRAPHRTESLQLYTLAGASRARIALRCKLPLEIVRCWERLFFDVKPLLKYSSAIATVTVRHAESEGNFALAAKMKLALGAGLVGVEAIERAAAGVALSDADKIYQRELQLDLKFQETLCMPIESEMARVAFQTAVMENATELRRIDLAKQRLLKRCERVMARLEIARLQAMQPVTGSAAPAHKSTYSSGDTPSNEDPCAHGRRAETLRSEATSSEATSSKTLPSETLTATVPATCASNIAACHVDLMAPEILKSEKPDSQAA